MARDTSTDDIAKRLVERYVTILKPLANWGQLASGEAAVYPELGLPQPQEPFPNAYCYVAGIRHDWGLIHQGIRRDTYQVSIRILGGMITPGTRVATGGLRGEVPEIAVYTMLNAVQNELVFRPFLNDPDTNEAFRYVDPNNPAIIGDVGRVAGFSYSDQGTFVGIEVPAIVSLLIRLGRAG